MSRQLKKVQRLRALLEAPGLVMVPCCYDAFSARLIEEAGFSVSFMSGFAVSAARLGLPDTGLISYSEMLNQGRNICDRVEIPVFGDGDTGYGNPVNVKRTVHGYIGAGFAGIMVEDQQSPKRCGHLAGKAVVGRDEAEARMGAVIEACDEARAQGSDMVVVARTDARATLGLDEAIARARLFSGMGADVLFVEAPRSKKEMERICREAPGRHLANVLEQGKSPILSPDELETLGFKLAAYPLTLLSASARAMQKALSALKRGKPFDEILPFSEITDLLGLPEYNETLERLEKRGRDTD